MLTLSLFNWLYVVSNGYCLLLLVICYLLEAAYPHMLSGDGFHGGLFRVCVDGCSAWEHPGRGSWTGPWTAVMIFYIIGSLFTILGAIMAVVTVRTESIISVRIATVFQLTAFTCVLFVALFMLSEGGWTWHFDKAFNPIWKGADPKYPTRVSFGAQYWLFAIMSPNLALHSIMSSIQWCWVADGFIDSDEDEYELRSRF